MVFGLCNGVDEETGRVLIADRGKHPYELDLETLKQARGSRLRPYVPKNRIADLQLPDRLDEEQLTLGIMETIGITYENMVHPPIKNLGLKGIDKWAKLVLKWPDQFPGEQLFGCLHNILTLLDTSGTGGGGFRKMYAQFLKEAGKLTGDKRFTQAAAGFTAGAKCVDKIIAAAFPEDWPALTRYKELAYDRVALLENNTADAMDQIPQVIASQEKAIKKAEAELRKRNVDPLIQGLNHAINDYLETETEALDALGKLLA